MIKIIDYTIIEYLIIAWHYYDIMHSMINDLYITNKLVEE